MGVERMKDPLCDARASQAFFYARTVLGCQSRRGGNATEGTGEGAAFVFNDHVARVSVRQCLVDSKFQKFYKISRHIKFLDACMEH
jgi:hypothetical protein